MVFRDGGPRVNTMHHSCEKPERTGNIENIETFVETRTRLTTVPKTEFHKKKTKKICARETSSIPLHESHPRRELLSLTIVEWVRMAKFIGISSWKVRGLVRFEDNVTELNIPQVLLFNSPRQTSPRFPVMPSSKSVSIWIVKRDSRFYRFLSFHLPFLSSPSLDAFTKVSALNDTLKFEAHILRRVRQLRRHSELWTSALLHDGSLPMTRELLGSPVFNPPSPLPYTNHPLSSCVFNYRRNSFEIYPPLYSSP